MNDLDYARHNLTLTKVERFDSAGRHLAWLRNVLASESLALRALAEDGNLYAQGHRAGLEAALHHLGVLDDVLLAEAVVAEAEAAETL